jgi:type II protein arginine methyltransferase
LGKIKLTCRLQRRQKYDWKKKVKVVHADMRYWDPPEKCDILVSELLGSFGDNELAPECLDGAQRLLKSKGVSIPSKYTAYVAPLSSASLYNRATSFEDKKHLETPYVVKFLDVLEIAPSLPVWHFEHPNFENTWTSPGHPDFNMHNSRYSVNSFNVAHSVLMVS